MMYLKNSPTGIDKPIQAMQSFLYGALKPIWNLNDTTFSMYGRAFRNQTTDGYVPEVFTSGADYKEVFFDDTVSASAFFGVKESITYDAGTATADAFLIFMVNLDKIKSPGTRQDEEARIDVELLCSQIRNGFKMVGFNTGLDTVFAEYSGWRKKSGIMFRDQSSSHCFRINFKLVYKINV